MIDILYVAMSWLSPNVLGGQEVEIAVNPLAASATCALLFMAYASDGHRFSLWHNYSLQVTRI